jgi:hypothetical protein
MREIYPRASKTSVFFIAAATFISSAIQHENETD